MCILDNLDQQGKLNRLVVDEVCADVFRSSRCPTNNQIPATTGALHLGGCAL